MDNATLLKRIDELQAQLDQLKSYATIPLDIGEAFKARIIGQNGTLLGKSNASVPATIGVFVPPSTNYTVAAPFTKQITVVLDNVTYLIPAN